MFFFQTPLFTKRRAYIYINTHVYTFRRSFDDIQSRTTRYIVLYVRSFEFFVQSISLSLSFPLFFARIHDLDANESGQYSVSAPRWHASRTERYKRFFRFALFFARTIFQASFLPNYSFVKYFTIHAPIYRFIFKKIRSPVLKSLPSTLERKG